MAARPTKRPFQKAVAILLLLIAAYFVLGRVARNMAITRLRDMGVSVKTKRVTGVFSPIPMPVCWIEVGDNVLDDKQLEQFFIAVRQINMNDCRVALGKTAVTQAQRDRLMESASNVQGHTIPPATDDLTWISTSESSERQLLKASRVAYLYFRNDSATPVRIFGSSRRGNKFLATLTPGRSIQTVRGSEYSWLVTDESDTPLGHLGVEESGRFNGTVANAVIPASIQ